MEEFRLPHRHGSQSNTEDLRRQLTKSPRFDDAAELFRQLADPTRVRIFWLLCHREECVINIAAMLGMSSPAVSHHLRSLSAAGLTVSRRDGKETYYKAADTKAGGLIHEIVEQVLEIACPEKRVDYSAPKEAVIRQIHDDLTEHLSERITIEDLSRRYLMNPTTLKKVFRDVYGTSLAEHMRMHRLEKAASLLLETNESISEIALAVGYESPSRFSSAFRKSYGKTPLEYRHGSTGTSRMRPPDFL